MESQGKGNLIVLVLPVLVAMIVIAIWGDQGEADRTPPSTDLVVTDGVVNWDGRGMCVDLERWTGRFWDRIASAGFEDAKQGRWEAPQEGERFCSLAATLGGSISMPSDLGNGIYRVCDLAECTEIRLAR